MNRHGELRQMLGQYFSKDELRSLCFDLGIDYENFPESKDGLARELILDCERQVRLADLLQICQEFRPHITWPISAAPLPSPLPYEPETLHVPTGPFQMGAGSTQQELNLPAYHLGKYPVTNEQYAEFIKHNPQQDQPENAGWSGRRPPRDKVSHPVVKVSWNDALAYCRWLSQVTGRPYRLATEAEWEKAARGEAGYLYPWGNAWTDGVCNADSSDTAPIDRFPDGGSPFGCMDMVGNVQQWTSTLWGKDAHESAFPFPYDAQDGREALKADPTWPRVFRIHRGGHFKDDPLHLQATCRGKAVANSKFSRRGFRVARDA